MKTYFVTSDIHSFYTEFKKELWKQGFDTNNKDHILIVCGDLFDRGKEAKKLLDFLYALSLVNRLILIKGNHEYLFDKCLEQLKDYKTIDFCHYTNGTLDTIAQLSNTNINDLIYGDYTYRNLRKSLDKYYKLINTCYNYYELDDYIFVHGWIPHIRDYETLKTIDKEEWERSSWSNGMQEWNNGWRLEYKTIVCGHWHTSFGNYHYHNKGSGEFETDSNFGIFKDNGIIALDACTSFSKKVNILKITV